MINALYLFCFSLSCQKKTPLKVYNSLHISTDLFSDDDTLRPCCIIGQERDFLPFFYQRVRVLRFTYVDFYHRRRRHRHHYQYQFKS